MREDRKGPAPSNRPTRRAWRGVFFTAARALAVGVIAIGIARAQDPAAEDSVGAIRNAYYKLRAVASANSTQIKPGEVLELVDRCWKIYDQSADATAAEMRKELLVAIRELRQTMVSLRPTPAR